MACHKSPRRRMMEKALIAAVADGMAIGRDNSMPWHISEDLKYFKRTTLGCPVIMGSATFRSLGGRPLPRRLNIVLSRSAAISLPEGVRQAGSLDEAYAVAEESGASRCFVTGGGQVYAEAIGSADALYITRVHAAVPDADAFFPEIDPSVWRRCAVSQTMKDPETGYDFEFEEYRKL